MLNFLKQPYPLQIDLKHNCTIAFIAGVCVFSIFYFFRPFGIELNSDKRIAILGLQYASITIVLSLFCNTLVPRLLPKLFNEKNWTVFSEIIFLAFVITIIAIGNFVFTSYSFHLQNSFSLFLYLLFYTLGFGIIPILISVLIKQQNLLRKYSTEANTLDALIVQNNEKETSIVSIDKGVELSQKETVTPSNFITIKGNNQKESLFLLVEDFLYAEAADNYTTIHFLKNNSPQQVLFRMSIKNVEEQHHFPEILFRCHKSYIINLLNVNHISGNAQGYSLHIANGNTKIPVSRSLNAVIKEKISSNLQHSS